MLKNIKYVLVLVLVHVLTFDPVVGQDGSLGVLATLRNLLHQSTGRNSNSNSNSERSGIPREAFMTTPELIRHHGYKVEEHKITTDDGFILSAFRIPSVKKGGGNSTQKEPVMLFHCFLCSSDDWLLLPNPKDNLPYLLAEDGHDVWLGNIRGNSYSQGNSKGLKSSNSNYYDFSMDEPGTVDIPSMIRYILKTTGAPKVSYVCHSMGCNLIVMAISEYPELNNSLKKLSLLAPGIYAYNALPFQGLNQVTDPTLQTFANRFTGGRMIPGELVNLVKRTGPFFCNRGTMKELCIQITSLFTGLNVNKTITDNTMLKIYGHTPSDTSMKLFLHYRQLLVSGGFHKFDHGLEKNMEMYGSPQPPSYNLSNIRVPVQGFYSLKDTNVPSANALRAFSELDNSINVDVIEVKDPEWVHIDFIYAKDAKAMVYDDVIRFLSS